MILATRKAPIFGSKEARQLDVAQHESSRNVRHNFDQAFGKQCFGEPASFLLP